MSENLKTIKEIADELQVPKIKLYKFINQKKYEYSLGKKNTRLFDNKTKIKIKKDFLTERSVNEERSSNEERSVNEERSSNEERSVNELDYLKRHIKDLQIVKEEQFKQIKNLTNLLDQQQRLALQDKQLLNEYKSENDKLKSLQNPNHYEKDERDKESPLKELEFENKALKEELAEKEKQSQEALTQLRNELNLKQHPWWKFWD